MHFGVGFQSKSRVEDVFKQVCTHLELLGMRDTEIFGLALEIGEYIDIYICIYTNTSVSIHTDKSMSLYQ